MNNIQYPKNYIVWDFETSGLDPQKNVPIELGFIQVENGQIKNEKTFLLKTPRLKLDKIITDITGITDEMLDKEGVDMVPAITAFEELFHSNMPHVTHNGLRFDIPFLEYALQLNGVDYDTDFERNAIDTAVIYKAQKLNMPRRFNETFAQWGKRVMDVKAYGVKYNVGICCEELGIEKTDQHRALADVLLTNEIYKKLTN